MKMRHPQMTACKLCGRLLGWSSFHMEMVCIPCFDSVIVETVTFELTGEEFAKLSYSLGAVTAFYMEKKDPIAEVTINPIAEVIISIMNKLADQAEKAKRGTIPG